jgi:hypothetical protein
MFAAPIRDDTPRVPVIATANWLLYHNCHSPGVAFRLDYLV